MFQPCIGQYFINKNDLRVNTRSHQPTVLGSNTKKIHPAVKLRIQGSFPALIDFSHLCTEITENLLNDIIYTACCLSQHSPMYSGPEYSCHIPLCYISRANVKMPSHAHLSSIEEDNSSKKADLKRNSNSIMREQKMASITHSQRSFNLFCFQRAFFWMQMFKGNLFRLQERRLSRLSRLRRRWGISSLLRWLNIGRLSKIKITAALEMPLQ